MTASTFSALRTVHEDALATEAKAASLAAEIDRLSARAATWIIILSVLPRAQFGRRRAHRRRADRARSEGRQDAARMPASSSIDSDLSAKIANLAPLPPVPAAAPVWITASLRTAPHASNRVPRAAPRTPPARTASRHPARRASGTGHPPSRLVPSTRPVSSQNESLTRSAHLARNT